MEGSHPTRVPSRVLPNPSDKPDPCKVSATPKVTKEDLIVEFPTVFDGTIRTMPGDDLAEYDLDTSLRV